MKNAYKYSLIVATTLLLPLGAAIADDDAQTADGERSAEQRISDAWITGKLEAVYALNSHLSPFAIETKVETGMVRLSGVVDSDIDRDLAGELAKGIEGVKTVENELEVDSGDVRESEGAKAQDAPAEGDDGEREFGVWVDDTTTTAAVKSKLIANGNVAARNIDVTTHYDVVTLTGVVSSEQEKQLAGEIALNTGDVSRVRNELTVE